MNIISPFFCRTDHGNRCIPCLCTIYNADTEVRCENCFDGSCIANDECCGCCFCCGYYPIMAFENFKYCYSPCMCREPDKYCNLCCAYYDLDKPPTNFNYTYPCMFGNHEYICTLCCCTLDETKNHLTYCPLCCCVRKIDNIKAPCCFKMTRESNNKIDEYDVCCCCFIEKINTTIIEDSNEKRIQRS